MIIAQISDLHLRADGLVRGDIDSAAALRAALERLAALDQAPDVVLLTGDLVNKEQGQDYRLLGQILSQVQIPTYVLAGNHDDRAMIRETFGAAGYLPGDGPFLHYVIEDAGPLRIVCLDTQDTGRVSGRMCGDRLAWLDARLSEQPERPTLIAMHHPPFPTGVSYMDKWRFEGADELAALVCRHPQVRLIACGHLHRHIVAQWAKTVAVTAPSLVFQMDLRLAPGAASAYRLEPPGFLLHVWGDDGMIATHPVVIGDFGAPRPFN